MPKLLYEWDTEYWKKVEIKKHEKYETELKWTTVWIRIRARWILGKQSTPLWHWICVIFFLIKKVF